MRRSLTAALAALVVLCLAMPAGAQGLAGMGTCTINGFPCWLAYPTASDDNKCLTYDLATRMIVLEACGTGGGLSGLTATRIPFAADATSIEDDAGLTYAKGTDTLSVQGPVVLGIDAAGGVANTAGQLKLFSAGDNAFYTTITSGTNNPGNIAYTLPVDDGAASTFLQSNGSGVLSWVAQTAEADTLATVTARGADTNVTTGTDLRLFTSGAGGVIAGTVETIGSKAGCSSAGSTTITCASHGLTLYPGDLVRVTGATTAADIGMYSLISSGASTLVVSRRLAGSDADVALTVYRQGLWSGPLRTIVSGPTVINAYQTSAANLEHALDVHWTPNKASGSADDVGLRIIQDADMASPGNSYAIRVVQGTTDKLTVTAAGALSASSTISTNQGIYGLFYNANSPTLGYKKTAGQGGSMEFTSLSEAVTLSGTTTDSAGDLLPEGAELLGISYRITTIVTGATSFTVGDATTPARFCGAQSTLAAGTTGRCMAHRQGSISTDATGPVQDSAAKIRFTSAGGDFSGGVVRVQVYYLKLTPPTS